ncbi:MAG: HlyD family efflux transporter periplasmic adaptor subunit [Acidobacteriota bacterium]|nr:HlyD family efflux transporter periplasmic adaptor subunit [Acidobacteriota bacterium]
MKKPVWIAIIVAVLVFLGVEGYANLRHFRKPALTTPIAAVRRGNVALRVYATGALTAEKMANILAPRVSGNDLTIVKLLPTGASVKAGDVIVAFDPAGEEYNLAQAQAQLKEAEDEISKANADAKVQTAQDQSLLLTDQYEVEKDKIIVSTNPLLSAIDAKKNILALDQARRLLAQQQSDTKSHLANNQAALASAEQDKAKAEFGIQTAEQNIKNMTVPSPIDGLVEVQKNRSAAGGFFFTGMQLPDYQVGDAAYSGATIAEVIDPTQMQVSAAVDEAERGNVRTGQNVEITVDALPEVNLAGTVKFISGSAVQTIFQAGAPPTFDLTIALKRSDPRLRPGETVHLIVSGNPLTNVLYLPPQAIFQKNGSPVVYLKQGGSFTARPVKILYRTATRTVIEGLRAGDNVALVNPETAAGAAGPSSPAPAVSGPQGARGGG